ncbi:MAG: hypothetical protein JWO13_1172 [Acidobacteriales bacterium]|nr:hypothetical protein [Terriglobales bacterium]
MAAYLVVNIEVHDPVRYAEYIRLVTPTIEMFGGKYLARGGTTEVLEGEWHPKRLVIVEFPSAEKAREWWNSTEYAGPKEIRRSCSHGEIVLAEGK